MLKQVKCINKRNTGGKLREGAVYRVLVDVLAGVDFKGRECSGYILDNSTFPYVWDRTRFEDFVEPELPSIPVDEEDPRPGDTQPAEGSVVANAATDEQRLSDAEVEDMEAARGA